MALECQEFKLTLKKVDGELKINGWGVKVYSVDSSLKSQVEGDLEVSQQDKDALEAFYNQLEAQFKTENGLE